jgi:hypothetical protein
MHEAGTTLVCEGTLNVNIVLKPLKRLRNPIHFNPPKEQYALS